MVQLPYYKEQFADSTIPWHSLSMTAAGITSPDSWSMGAWATKETVMTSFRTRPKAEHFEEVSDQVADPYAYFLQDVSRRQFEQNLRDRGYDPGVTHPDRGHTLELHTFEPKGNYVTGAYRTGTTESSYRYRSIQNLLPVTTIFYDGPFRGEPGQPAVFPESSLPAFAQKAYSRVAPTYEQFNLARSLAELKQLPRVKLDFLSKSIAEWRFQGDKWIQKGANRLGDDSLNIMFGWAPLVKDVIDLCRALVSITTGMIEGPTVSAPVHRTFRGPVDVQTHTASGTTTGLYMGNARITTDPELSRGQFYGVTDGPLITWTATKRLTRRQWFEGSFTKFLPLGFDAKNYLDRADVLLGMELTPLTMWQLAPWTWLSDWVVDISSTLAANQAASDKSLISHYAYAMEETVASIYMDYNITPSSEGRMWSSSFPLEGHYMQTDTWKRRLRANPYGFVPGGPSGLNPFRTAVLAALGLSRL